MRHRSLDGHERLDALRWPIHQCQTNGLGVAGVNSIRIPRRLSSVHRDGHFCTAENSPGEIIEMMPKPVTIHDPWVRLKVT
jgi:hypothetical protein